MGLIEQLFYQGRYQDVLEKTYDDQTGIQTQHMPFIIGSLSFLGRAEEAEALFHAKQKSLSAVEKSYGHFFLSLAWTRRSQYQKARKHLKENQLLDQSEKFKNQQIRFLVCQGISFFLFYFAKFQKSLGWSQRSLNAAMAEDNLWMKALSLDLLANNLIQTGHIFEGLSHFQQAIKFSKSLQNQALIQAIEISHLIFRCEYGIEIDESFKELQTKYETFSLRDSFSKANLGLELSRQLTLRGRYKETLDVLNQISSGVYQSQNRRQEARLNLRWAECYFQKNELSTALHYIRSGQRSLEHVDKTYKMQFLGLEIKAYKNLTPQLDITSQQLQLQQLSEKFKTVVNENMQQRHSGKRSALESEEDQIHLLLQQAGQSDETAIKIILKTGFYSWIPRFLNISRGENYILLNLESKSLTCLDKNLIDHKPNELSSLNYKILKLLTNNFKTKEQIVETIWGYQYDPLRHDSLIYSAFSSLRKILDKHAYFLETSETGYQIKAQVLEVNPHEQTAKKSEHAEVSKHQSVNFTIDTPDTKMKVFLKLGLNPRQIQIIQYLEKNQFIAVKNVQDFFTVSEITANRDLRSLTEAKLVLRIGQGRATRYTLNQFSGE